MRLVIYLLTILIILLIPITILADDGIIVRLDDPANDDYGPGTYKYPKNEVFAGEGLFDIVQFSINEQNDNYTFHFVFSSITDPWNSRYGFSHPLIEIYIDNDKQGSNQPWKEGANFRFSSGFNWNILLKICGWWVRSYGPEDVDVLEEADIDLLKIENNPYEVEDVDIEVNNNQINMTIPKTIIGDLDNSQIVLMVGGFDPFGPDNFRVVKEEPSEWYFSDPDHQNIEYATNIIDIITPDGKKQETMLTGNNDSYPVLEPISVRSYDYQENYFSLLVVIILLLLVLFIMNKKQLISHNK